MAILYIIRGSPTFDGSFFTSKISLIQQSSGRGSTSQLRKVLSANCAERGRWLCNRGLKGHEPKTNCDIDAGKGSAQTLSYVATSLTLLSARPMKVLAFCGPEVCERFGAVQKLC